MKKAEKEVEQRLLNNEKDVLKQLEQTYVKADPWGATANTIAMRGGSGTVKVGNPNAQTDATNKQYVDNLPTKLTLTNEQQSVWQNWLGIERWEDFSIKNDNVNISQSTKTVKKVKIKQGNVFTVDGVNIYDIISDCEITLTNIDTYSYGYMLLRNQANGDIDTYKIGCQYRQMEGGTYVGFNLNFLSATTIRVLTSI